MSIWVHPGALKVHLAGRGSRVPGALDCPFFGSRRRDGGGAFSRVRKLPMRSIYVIWTSHGLYEPPGAEPGSRSQFQGFRCPPSRFGSGWRT